MRLCVSGLSPSSPQEVTNTGGLLGTEDPAAAWDQGSRCQPLQALHTGTLPRSETPLPGADVTVLSWWGQSARLAGSAGLLW